MAGRILTLMLAAAAMLWPLDGHAQEQAPAQNTAAPAAAAQAPEDDPDRDPRASQPDFVIVNLPTTLRVPRFKSAFRIAHRFGLMRGLQVGILRTSDRTIDFFTQYNLRQQGEGGPVGLGIVAAIDGTNNFRDSYSPSVGLVVSRELGSHGAVYFEPMWVNNTNPLPGEVVDDNDTVLLGLGARIRVRPTVYVVGELIPRVGHDPGVNHATFGIEKRAGGHVFQFNFSNGLGNTMSQLARGGTSNDDWYIGFNISRKFF